VVPVSTRMTGSCIISVVIGQINDGGQFSSSSDSETLGDSYTTSAAFTLEDR